MLTPLSFFWVPLRCFSWYPFSTQQILIIVTCVWLLLFRNSWIQKRLVFDSLFLFDLRSSYCSMVLVWILSIILRIKWKSVYWRFWFGCNSQILWCELYLFTRSNYSQYGVYGLPRNVCSGYSRHCIRSRCREIETLPVLHFRHYLVNCCLWPNHILVFLP